MTEIVKETTLTTQGSNINPVVNTTATKATSLESKATSAQTVEYLIYFFFGAIDILLVSRLLLKLAGASTLSAFVGMIYSITGIFILPFEGIFRRGVSQGSGLTSVFEPSALVAIIVYVVVAWGIVKLIRIFSGEPQYRD